MRYKRFLKHKGFLSTDDKGSCFCSSHFLSSNHYLGVKENRNLANRRRRWQKPNQMVLIMLAITMVCVVIVFAIVMVQKEKGTIVKQARAVTKDMVYENAYIVSNDDGRLIFICDGDLYRAKGTMEENFTGVCDIEISGSKVKKIQIKPDDISGVMLSYGDGTMQIAGQGDIPMQSSELPVYDETGTSPKEIAVSDLIIGSETLSYILDSGRICAIVRRQAPDLTYIRVLIKNDGKDAFPTIAAAAAANIYVDDADCGSNAIDDVSAYMANAQKSRIKVSSADNYVSINGKSYPGSFEFIGTEEGIVAVNTVDVETYVRYVLPSEMPSTFDAEALKAQAVCARTFVYSQMKNTQYALYGANIDNTTAFQVYNASETKQSTDEAVKATAGQVVSCGGSLITCYYFSTSAGKTEDMEVWSSSTPDFIHKVESVDDNSPYYRWTSELDLSAYNDPQYGTATGISVDKTSDAGYVLSLTINYGNKSQTFTAENDIRKALGHYQKKVTLNDGSVRENMSMIPSACFSVSAGANGHYTLSGGGFGHGIGFSQYGADKLAKAGSSYKDIIGYYYKDVTVVDISSVRSEQ